MIFSKLIIKDYFLWVTCYDTSNHNEHPNINYKLAFKTSALPPILSSKWIPSHISFFIWFIDFSLVNTFPQGTTRSSPSAHSHAIIRTKCLWFIFQICFHPIVQSSSSMESQKCKFKHIDRSLQEIHILHILLKPSCSIASCRTNKDISTFGETSFSHQK
jgi:hypothetical protein